MAKLITELARSITMNEIAERLSQLGENAEIKHRQVHVKFSFFMSKLVIRKDIATNKLIYSYNQPGDFIAIIAFFTLSGTQFQKGTMAFAMFSIGVALVMLAASVIKEIKVMAIKREVNDLLKEKPHLKSINSLSTELNTLSPHDLHNHS